MVRVVDRDGHTRAYAQADSAGVMDGVLHLYRKVANGSEEIASFASGKWDRWWIGEEKLEGEGQGPLVG